MPISTKLTRALGITHPLIQGGMHYVGYAPLVAAVGNAGAIGCITALTQPSPEALQKEIRACKALSTKPFGVNLTLLPMLQPPNYDAFAQVVEDEMASGQLRMIETAGHFKGLEPFVIRFKAAGAFVIHKCVTIRHAKSAEKVGVDMISMDGFDCAGHPGEADIGNWVLFAKAARELKIPFVASGGCADGKQLAAAIAMGAEGMNMGTRFMATVEAPIHDNIKQALVDGDEHSTTLLMRSMRNTERVYKNQAALKVLEIEKEHPGDFSKIGHILSGDNYRRAFQETGDVEEGVWSAGTVMGLIDSVVTCQELCDNIVSEAEEVITGRLANSVTLVSDDVSSVDPPKITPHCKWPRVLHYTVIDNFMEKRIPHRQAHIRLAEEFMQAGKLVMKGARGDLIFRSREDAFDFVSLDPYVKYGIVTDYAVREWSMLESAAQLRPT
eukprot:GFUD01000731.1.p1 GENE.GFUD01000731.1~~GFUD01000731.1.p1  ORF type:complete len:441 (-),score=133.35 GFUD01000731.1:545-1867(-)